MPKRKNDAELKVRELEKELQLFNRILSNTYDWQTFRDRNGKLVYSSPAMERITGYRNADYLSGALTFADLVHPDDLPFVQNEHRRALSGEIVPSSEFRIIRSDRSIVTVEVSAHPVYDSVGEFEGFRLSIRDITDRRAAENKLKEYSLRLAEMNENKDRFLLIIAHDLKSPFNTLLSLTDLLLTNIEKYDINEIRTFLQYIHNSASRTFGLVENLLLWSNSQLNRIPFNPSSFCLADIAGDVLSGLREGAEKKKIRISFTIPDHIYVNADINMVKTIIRNLIYNAVKFTYPNGLIRIAARKLKGKILISITDNGTGIAKEDQPKIWKFLGGYTTEGTSGEKGSGFGLSICRDFIDKHGEQIWMESRLGKGSNFMFTLPEDEK